MAWELDSKVIVTMGVFVDRGRCQGRVTAAPTSPLEIPARASSSRLALLDALDDAAR
jgi:hypothetical protein